MKPKGNPGMVIGGAGKLELITDDSDVDKERFRIENEINQTRSNLSDLLVADKLTKKFGNFTAVDEMTFGVHYNECFGLLGVNGAGKTTIFSMLTGDLLPTTGNAYIQKGKYSLIEHMHHFQGTIGYCPQFDALLGKKIYIILKFDLYFCICTI